MPELISQPRRVPADAESVAICLPAFAPEIVHRDD
jgi:hypothetical protein